MNTTSRAGPANKVAIRRATGRRDDRDAGMVTVEAAVALCAFVTMVALALAGFADVLDQIRCTDAAREAARLVARGEQDRAREAVDRIAPRGATLSVATTADTVTVVVATDSGGLPPGIHVRAEAYAVREPQPADSAPTAARMADPPGGHDARRPAEGAGR